VIVTLLRVDCRDDAAADEFDKLTARVFQQVSHHEPGTLVFANHMVAGQPLTRVFYEIYRDQKAANIHSRGEALQQLLASQDALVAGFHIDQLTLELAKGLPPGRVPGSPRVGQPGAQPDEDVGDGGRSRKPLGELDAPMSREAR
jgi:quinol monooxygenase YgiN